MSEQQNDFQVKIAAEVKLTKKRIYIEEVRSLVTAIGFSMSMCCVFMFPFSFMTFISILIGYMSIKHFKPTVKAQYYLHQHLKFLATAKDDKVWTPNDS